MNTFEIIIVVLLILLVSPGIINLLRGTKKLIDSKHHGEYKRGFKEGQTLSENQLEKLILYLAINIPSIDPFRIDAVHYICGLADVGIRFYGRDFGRKSISQKEINMGNGVPICIPLGSWDLKSGLWYPNPLLEMTADDQYKRNIKNGLPCIRGDCIIQ